MYDVEIVEGYEISSGLYITVLPTYICLLNFDGNVSSEINMGLIEYNKHSSKYDK